MGFHKRFLSKDNILANCDDPQRLHRFLTSADAYITTDEASSKVIDFVLERNYKIDSGFTQKVIEICNSN